MIFSIHVTTIFQLKLFDTAVTLKYHQGHCMWNVWVKLNEYYLNGKFDIYRVDSVQENRNAKVFATHEHLASQQA